MSDDQITGSAPDDSGSVRYRRARYSTRLYRDCYYTPGHVWLREETSGLWRIGFTRFALRMLGDPVELDFEVKVGENLDLGQEIGWIEGFKAVSDLYTPMSGTFRGGNDALVNDIELLARDPHREGWLFRVEGAPGSDCLDVEGYISVLDRAIDKIMGNIAPS